MVSFGFSNAFPSLTHPFITAVLRLTCLPPTYIQFILATLVAPYHFCVGRGVVREALFCPWAGIGQGDPFSPVLFSFCVSLVLYLIGMILRVSSYMFADDLRVLIGGKRVVLVLQKVYDCMKEFGLFSGLKLNLGKCGVVIKIILHSQDQQHIKAKQDGELLLGMRICQSVKYLGVRMGNITSDEAYAFPLVEAQRRASVVANLHLSLRERIVLLKTWVLPIVLLIARAYFLSDITIRSLKIVYNTTLHLSNRGVTLQIISQESELGGYQLPPPPLDLGACAIWITVSQICVAAAFFLRFCQNCLCGMVC